MHVLPSPRHMHARNDWLCRSGTRSCTGDSRSDPIKICRGQLESRRADPAVNLCWGTCANNRRCHTWPSEGPGDGHCRYRRAVTRGDRPERIPQCEVPTEPRLLEFTRAAAPVVCCELAASIRTEAVAQEPRLHRAITDDTRAMFGTPRNLMSPSLATNHGKGWLKRLHVMNRLAPLKEPDIEIRDTCRPYFSFFDEPDHLGPRVLHRYAGLIRPVELIEIDPIHAQPPERCLALSPN